MAITLQVEMNHEGQREARGPTAASKRGHKTRKMHRCIYCPYASHFITNYRKHMSTHTGEKPYACHYCPYRSNARDHLYRHMQRHTGVKPFRCSFCPLSCARRVDLNNHMLTQHAHSSMDRPLPDVVALNRDGHRIGSGGVAGLMKAPVNRKLHKCSHCPFTTHFFGAEVNAVQLYVRVSVHESICKIVAMDHDCQRKAFGGIMEETQNPVKRRSHSCPYCTYTTDVSTNLHKHITTHTGEKAYACPYCPYRSNSKDHVKRHTLTHTGEKPFACTKCHYRSTQKRTNVMVKVGIQSRNECISDPLVSLVECVPPKLLPPEFPGSSMIISIFKSIENMRLESDRKRPGRRTGVAEQSLTTTTASPSKIHQCSYCAYTTNVATNLKNHIRTHTGETPFKCMHCSYSSTTKQSLIYHVRTHTGEKPYACPHCSYRCTQLGSMKSHMFKHHEWGPVSQ
ncbi:zinc finger protein 497 [Penaeus vannamei]|uniref:zinc finger protein 497 n=1 Tax=Penaeus vannamei TaxID=6689 RepID=UPI00387F5057